MADIWAAKKGFYLVQEGVTFQNAELSFLCYLAPVACNENLGTDHSSETPNSPKLHLILVLK